jgi:hypothetical protein
MFFLSINDKKYCRKINNYLNLKLYFYFVLRNGSHRYTSEQLFDKYLILKDSVIIEIKNAIFLQLQIIKILTRMTFKIL